MSIASNFPAIKPSLNLDFANTKMLDSRVTFTRASTGTYYNGVTTAKAEENLLTYSQAFDNAAWNPVNLTITANTTAAPDGTTTADTINEGTATGLHNVQQAGFSYVSGSTYTQSVFAKADTATVIQMSMQSIAFGTDSFANYDLTNGVLGTVGSSSTATITSVGNGWYRLTLTATATTTTTQNTGFVFLCDNNTSAARAPSYTGTNKQLFIWGAQLEKRSVVTAYTVTTTQAITNYIPVLLTAQSGVPRFDHNPTTDESLGLLIEESRTNLVTYSEQFDNAAWTKTRSSITANAIAAPDGTITADTLVEDTTANNTHYLSRSAISVTSGTAYTISAYFKKAQRTQSALRFYPDNSAFSTGTAIFDLDTGTVVSATAVTATIQNVGNGWYRCSATATATATANALLGWHIANGNTVTYTGDGYSGIYIWGAQLEAGAFATSYIQTVAATVTRAADAASMTGANFSSWYNAGEGTLFTEAKTLSVGSASRVICEISNGTTSNRSQQTVNSSGSLVWFVNSGGVTSANSITSGSTSSNTNFKIASAYKVNDFATVGNAQAAATSTSGNTALDQNNLRIGARFDDTLRINGTIKKFAYYPIRCTNAQLQALTS